MKDNFRIIAETGKNDSEKRADRIFRKILPDLNLSAIYREMRNGKIRINGKKVKPSARVTEGDKISIHLSLDKHTAALTGFTNPPEIENNKNYPAAPPGFTECIIFENDNIIALNKKRGMLVHSGDIGSGEKTLENDVNRYLKGVISPSLTFRPGPLHRLDRNTSGLVLFGKSIEGARKFSSMIKDGETEKFYFALFDGCISNEVRWENSLVQNEKLKKSEMSDSSGKSKTAVTIVKPVIYSKDFTIALVNIPTGRYHQIRKQGQLNNHPLTGDSKYNGKKKLPFYLLHAYRISISDNTDLMGFSTLTAALPDFFLKTASELFSSEKIKRLKEFIKAF